MTTIKHNLHQSIVKDTADVRNFASAVSLAVEHNLVPPVMFKSLTTLSLFIIPNWPLSDLLPFLLASPCLYHLVLSCSDFSKADPKFKDAMASLLENCPLLSSLTLDLGNFPSNQSPVFTKDTIHTGLRSLNTSCDGQPIHLYFPIFPCLQELTLRGPENVDNYKLWPDYHLDLPALLHFKVETAAKYISLKSFNYISSADSLVSFTMQYTDAPPFPETIERTLIKIKQICSSASFHDLIITSPLSLRRVTRLLPQISSIFSAR